MGRNGYSAEIFFRVKEDLTQGFTLSQAAKRNGVSRQTVATYLTRDKPVDIPTGKQATTKNNAIPHRCPGCGAMIATKTCLLCNLDKCLT